MNTKKEIFCPPAGWLKKLSLILLSVTFVAAGTNHFLSTEMYVSIMPPYLSAHVELVYISGVFEILGGLGILLCRFRTAAAIGLILLTIAVFPANLHMALNPQEFSYIAPAWVWAARLPLQLVILAWIYFSCLSQTKPH